MKKIALLAAAVLLFSGSAMATMNQNDTVKKFTYASGMTAHVVFTVDTADVDTLIYRFHTSSTNFGLTFYTAWDTTLVYSNTVAVTVPSQNVSFLRIESHEPGMPMDTTNVVTMIRVPTISVIDSAGPNTVYFQSIIDGGNATTQTETVMSLDQYFTNTTSPWYHPVSGYTSVTTHDTITGLQPNTSYWFRTIVRNQADTVEMVWHTTTMPLPVAPEVLFGAFSGVTDSSFTYGGSVHTHGYPIDSLELFVTHGSVTDTFYQYAPSGTTWQNVSFALTDLLPNTWYYTRMRVHNMYGMDTTTLDSVKTDPAPLTFMFDMGTVTVSGNQATVSVYVTNLPGSTCDLNVFASEDGYNNNIQVHPFSVSVDVDTIEATFIVGSGHTYHFWAQGYNIPFQTSINSIDTLHLGSTGIKKVELESLIGERAVVINTLGQKVLEYTISSSLYPQKGTLPDGFYVISVISKDGTRSYCKKVPIGTFQ